MRSHSLSMVVAGAALVALLAGCTARNTFPTVQDVKDFAKEEREALNAHDTNMTKQHIAQHPDASGAIIASATTFRAEMGEIAKRVDAMEGSLKPFLERGLSGVLAMIGKLTGINLPLVDLFDKQDAKADANEKQAGANAVAIDDLEKWAEDMKAAAAKRDAHEREMQALLAALDQDTRDKFTKADKEAIAALEKLKDDRAAFDKEIQRQFQLTKEQMAGLKGMSTEQIISLLGVGGAAAAAGRFGPSRGQKETDKARREAREAREATNRSDVRLAALEKKQ